MILCLFLLTFLSNFFPFVLCQDKPYNFQPESRHVEVNEGENFIVSFQELDQNQTAFGHCHVEGGSFSANWTIYPPDEDVPCDTTKISTGFRPYSCSGICAFTYLNVDDNVPLEWTITAYDNATNKSFDEKVTVSFYYNIPTYLDRIVVLPASSALNFLQPGKIKLQRCTLGFDNTTVELDMSAVKTYNNNNIFKSRLTSLGSGKCGFKINNLALGESKELHLYGVDEANKVYRSSSNIVVIAGQNLVNRTIETYVGDSTRIYCGSRNQDNNVDSGQKYCYLYNPQGHLVTNDRSCQYDLDVVTLDDLGSWKCVVGYDYTMDSLELSTVLIEKSRESVDVFTEDSADYLIVGCKFNNFDTSRFEFCRFTRPDGKVFTLNEGTATAHYSSFSSDMANFRCSLEILKPLRDVDRGTWKCESSVLNRIAGGGFITVEASKNFPYDKYMKKNVQLGHSFVIHCMVPYASDNCYLVAPNRTQYKPDNGLQPTAGLCTLTVGKSTLTDNGTWYCSIAQKNGIPNEIIGTDIIIIELSVLYANAEASEGDQAQLVCNTNGIPLDYCRFVSPSGDVYSLRKGNSTFNKISYKGEGLEHGDCGIQISQISNAEAGEWSCHIGVGRYSSADERRADLTRKMRLRVNSSGNINLGESMGIVAGILAAAAAVGGIVFYRYVAKRRIGENTDVRAHFTARISDESTNSREAVNIAVSHNTYNTQN